MPEQNDPAKDPTGPWEGWRDLAWDLLNGETPKTDGADVIIRMSNRQHDQLLFAIKDVHDRAEALDNLYHGRTVAA
jgi:hypothetical protein